MRLVRGVGLQMASQCLLVLNYTLHTGAWVGIGVVAIMEPSMEDEMVFPREKFWAVGAIVFVIVLVNPPVPSRAVAQLRRFVRSGRTCVCGHLCSCSCGLSGALSLWLCIHTEDKLAWLDQLCFG